MCEYKMAPKYILLTAPTLKQSRSTHINSMNTKSFEADYKNSLGRYQQIDEGKKTSKKSSLFTKQIDSVRDQLTSCIQNTINQTKRYNVLKQLITILQQSNKQLEEQSKNEWKQRVEMDKKRLLKEEYEVQQILQKYNEEVAKINTLRQMTNAARTDRVVYSALFKKIEWEIQHYQNLYRETIIKTEANRIGNSQKQAFMVDHFQSLDELQMKEQTSKPDSNQEQPSKNPLFVTELQKNSNNNAIKKSDTQRVNPMPNKLQTLIQQIENKIEQIVKRVECVSFQDTLIWYSSVQDQNNQLLKLIQKEEFKIDEIESQIQRINQVRRNSQVSEEKHLTRLESLPSTRKLRTFRVIKGTDIYEQSSSDFVIKLAKVAGINCKNRSLPDVVMEIQERLNRQQMINSESPLDSILQSGVDTILTKMQRFDNCERIFSKRQLQGEYMKELSKQKKHLRTRK